MLVTAAVGSAHPMGKSAMTNGKRLHATGIDGRTREARRFRDLIRNFSEFLGGEKALSEADRSLVRTAAALAVQNERLQADAVAGRKVSSEDMTRLANSSARILAVLKGRNPGSAHTSPMRDQFGGKYSGAP